MSGPGDTRDTEPSSPPDAELLAAIAGDLETLEGVARGLGDGLHELSVKLRREAERTRGPR